MEIQEAFLEEGFMKAWPLKKTDVGGFGAM